MAPLREKDFEPVRAVLSGEVSLTEMAQTYRPRQATITAVTILYAAAPHKCYNRWAVTYSEALMTLCQYPGEPVEGFPVGTNGKWIRPDWRERRWRWSWDLVDISRSLGLHMSYNKAGSHIRLTEQPLIAEWLRQDGFWQKACELYQAAVTRRQSQLDYRRVHS